MKEAVRLDRYTCDVCGCVKDVPESHESPLYRFALPTRKYDDYGYPIGIGISTAIFELCDSCANSLLENLETFYVIGGRLQGQAVMQKMKTKGE